MGAIVAGFSFALKTRPVIVEQAEPTTQRHQIYGVPAIIEDMVANGYASVFAKDGERYLAAYAMPGSEMPEGALRLRTPDVLATALTNVVAIAEDDPREIAELKAIVNGMEDELREYLADGVSDMHCMSESYLTEELAEEFANVTRNPTTNPQSTERVIVNSSIFR